MASTFRYRVYLEDGTDLDSYVTSHTQWGPGDTLYVGGVSAYRISRVIPLADPDNGEFEGIWEVALMEPAERAIPDTA